MAVTVHIQHVATLTSRVVLLSLRGKVELASSASRTSQCRHYWRYGYTHQRCPAAHPTCPICGLDHTRAAQRCLNPTCPMGEPISPSNPVARSRPLIAVTALTARLPHSGNVGLDLPLMFPTALPLQSNPLKTSWICRSIAVLHPLLSLEAPCPSPAPSQLQVLPANE